MAAWFAQLLVFSPFIGRESFTLRDVFGALLRAFFHFLMLTLLAITGLIYFELVPLKFVVGTHDGILGAALIAVTLLYPVLLYFLLKSKWFLSQTQAPALLFALVHWPLYCRNHLADTVI